jgi:hypothetical protein
MKKNYFKIFLFFRRCCWHRWKTFIREYLREFSKKIEMVLMGYSMARGTRFYEKNLMSKISCQTPFKGRQFKKFSGIARFQQKKGVGVQIPYQHSLIERGLAKFYPNMRPKAENCYTGNTIFSIWIRRNFSFLMVVLDDPFLRTTYCIIPPPPKYCLRPWLILWAPPPTRRCLRSWLTRYNRFVSIAWMVEALQLADISLFLPPPPTRQCH